MSPCPTETARPCSSGCSSSGRRCECSTCPDTRTRRSSTRALLKPLVDFFKNHFWPTDSSARFAKPLIDDPAYCGVTEVPLVVDPPMVDHAVVEGVRPTVVPQMIWDPLEYPMVFVPQMICEAHDCGSVHTRFAPIVTPPVHGTLVPQIICDAHACWLVGTVVPQMI